MEAIGGYFGLELQSGNHYHNGSNCIKLNTGRNCLEYLLKVTNYSKIYLPYFTCDVLLEPLVKLNRSYEFYCVDENLEPVFDYNKITAEEGFLYTNYFGLKDRFIYDLGTKVSNLIIDNAQSFFSAPLNGVTTFYSPRKFFGVSDGAYLYCNKEINEVLERDISYNRMSHLLIRKDVSAEAGYSSFVFNDKGLENQPIKRMSVLTESILGTLDYESIAKKRIENYIFLDNALKHCNLLSLQLGKESVPMVYPFWTKNLNLKKRLLENKIYTATYWPNVKEWCEEESLEYRLANEVVYLPIDQRYDMGCIGFMINLINNTI